MGRETKSNGRKDELDRFYTGADIVDLCLAQLDLSKYDLIIEPSAGDGAFSSKIPNCKAYDIDPQGENIEYADWLTLPKEQFIGNNILVVGNPPFGEQSTLAKAFFNESAKFANAIAFILPLSFKKPSVQNQLDLSFHLEKEVVLDNCHFLILGETDTKVPCVFQIWVKKSTKRTKAKGKTTTDLFKFVTADEADFRVQRVGGRAGKASFDLNYSASSNYFIKNTSKYSNEELVDKINNMIFPTIAFTVGPKSLSKTELVEVCEEVL